MCGFALKDTVFHSHAGELAQQHTKGRFGAGEEGSSDRGFGAE